MNVISFEASKKLKEAGVVPETVEVGQFWYDADETLAVIHSTANGSICYVAVIGTYEADYTQGVFLRQHVYAFTPADLLRLLPPDTVVQMWGGKPSVKFCAEKDGMFLEVRIGGGNLADILAGALLTVLADR